MKKIALCFVFLWIISDVSVFASTDQDCPRATDETRIKQLNEILDCYADRIRELEETIATPNSFDAFPQVVAGSDLPRKKELDNYRLVSKGCKWSGPDLHCSVSVENTSERNRGAAFIGNSSRVTMIDGKTFIVRDTVVGGRRTHQQNSVTMPPLDIGDVMFIFQNIKSKSTPASLKFKMDDSIRIDGRRRSKSYNLILATGTNSN